MSETSLETKLSMSDVLTGTDKPAEAEKTLMRPSAKSNIERESYVGTVNISTQLIDRRSCSAFEEDHAITKPWSIAVAGALQVDLGLRLVEGRAEEECLAVTGSQSDVKNA